MSVVINGVVHDHMETVFGLCKQLTDMDFFLKYMRKILQFSGHHTNISRDFKIMLAE